MAPAVAAAAGGRRAGAAAVRTARCAAPGLLGPGRRGGRRCGGRLRGSGARRGQQRAEPPHGRRRAAARSRDQPGAPGAARPTGERPPLARPHRGRRKRLDGRPGDGPGAPPAIRPPLRDRVDAAGGLGCGLSGCGVARHRRQRPAVHPGRGRAAGVRDAQGPRFAQEGDGRAAPGSGQRPGDAGAGGPRTHRPGVGGLRDAALAGRRARRVHRVQRPATGGAPAERTAAPARLPRRAGAPAAASRPRPRGWDGGTDRAPPSMPGTRLQVRGPRPRDGPGGRRGARC